MVDFDTFINKQKPYFSCWTNSTGNSNLPEVFPSFDTGCWLRVSFDRIRLLHRLQFQFDSEIFDGSFCRYSQTICFMDAIPFSGHRNFLPQLQFVWLAHEELLVEPTPDWCSFPVFQAFFFETFGVHPILFKYI